MNGRHLEYRMTVAVGSDVEVVKSEVGSDQGEIREADCGFPSK